MKSKMIAGITLALFLVSILSMVGSVSAPLSPSDGDINGDNVVNISDVVQWGLAFGSAPTSPNWDPAADINGDSVVDIFDGVVIGTNFGLEG